VIDLREPNRVLWLWLFNDGGAWTAHDLAHELGQDVERTFNQLSGMARRGIVERMTPEAGTRRLRYAVTGVCLVPHGLHVAEVQLAEDEIGDAVAPPMPRGNREAHTGANA
jgi:hypothetical protein